jgi:regulator of protease activity HflC (stomatin/prohibitin superfamily)
MPDDMTIVGNGTIRGRLLDKGVMVSIGTDTDQRSIVVSDDVALAFSDQVRSAIAGRVAVTAAPATSPQAIAAAAVAAERATVPEEV